MAYVLMAYILMASTVMAHTVMACIVMAFVLHWRADVAVPLHRPQHALTVRAAGTAVAFAGRLNHEDAHLFSIWLIIRRFGTKKAASFGAAERVLACANEKPIWRQKTAYLYRSLTVQAIIVQAITI